MTTEVFWVSGEYPGRIAMVARPRGGDWLESEISGWANAGIDLVVSMLEESETREFELEREAEFYRTYGIEFISFPVADRGVPTLNKEFLTLVKKLKRALLAGKSVAIHCRQSIGRAPLLAAAVMTLFDMESDEAFRRLSIARGREVPETPEQGDWIKRFSKERTLAYA